MKSSLLPSIALLSMGLASVAFALDNTPGADKALTRLQTKVQVDLASGAITQNDADELNREISRAQEIESRGASLTRTSRRDIRQDEAKIKKDLARMEAAKAASSHSAPTP